MSERVTILNEIRGGGYEASVITTFNAYLPFYEDVVLRHLLGSGIRHNVLMMDASQASLAIDRHPPRTAGRFYTLAPIKVVGAFHPKVILLIGKKRGTLLVGSHNLTLSGFGYNREMTNVILCKGEEDSEGIALLSSAWDFILDWAESQAESLPSHIIDMVRKVEDFAPWLQRKATALSDHCRVLSTGSKSQSLLEQLVEFAGVSAARRVTVTGAFFDSNLSFVERVRDEFAPAEVLVGIDPATVKFPVDKKVEGVFLLNCAHIGAPDKVEMQGYLHAKSVLIQPEEGDAILAVGSANPSYPAWLAPGMSQNVEMMIARKGPDAYQAADELGLLAIQPEHNIEQNDWLTIRENWELNEQQDESGQVPQVVIALAFDSDIRFHLPGENALQSIECDIVVIGDDAVIRRWASLKKDEYLISIEDLPSHASFIHFTVNGKQYRGVIQYVKQIEGLSRTTSQRRFNDALSSLATGSPNLERFVDCIREIIRISDTVALTRGTRTTPAQGTNNQTTNIPNEGAELSIGLNEVVEREQLRKQRLRGADDLGYLLDVLLYNLRDESPAALEDVLETRDAMGRSEEEQINADDEDDVPLPSVNPAEGKDEPPARNPLEVCHYKVGTLISLACEKLDALKQGRMELPQMVIVLAGILSALRLLRGLDGKVPWIGAGQTAVPKKEMRKLFNKIAEVTYDGATSIICLGENYAQLSDFDELARLKGLVVWLAWECGISVTSQKPFNESLEERSERLEKNRLYVATAQLVAGDDATIQEAQQSIGQLSSTDMSWLEKLLRLDRLFRSVVYCSDQLVDGTAGKSGDFAFNILNPASGIREILTTDGGRTCRLSCHNSNSPRYGFQAENVCVIPFVQILAAQ